MFDRICNMKKERDSHINNGIYMYFINDKGYILLQKKYRYMVEREGTWILQWFWGGG